MYDHAVRRLAQRFGREKGVRIYIPAEELKRIGYGAEDGPVYYRTRADAGGRIRVQLYRSP